MDFHVIDGKFQGSRSHLLGLFAALVQRHSQHRYFFFLEGVEALRAMPAFRGDHVTLVRSSMASSMIRLAWQLPRLRRRYRLDVLHTQYILPLGAARGNAVTIHDILFENYPQFFTWTFVRRSRLLVPWSARHADLLCTVSEFSRRELEQRYGIKAPIVVLPNAVDERFHPGNDGSELIHRRGLEPRQYILSVGRIEPRKNYPSLLKAYSAMEGHVPPLVIVGQRDFKSAAFEAALAALPPERRPIILSDVRDEELPAFYRHALLFAYPSFAEGFGMPPLEAMASGTPVIAASTTALPEVLGTAALLIDPTDERALCQALQRLCADAELRARLIAAGLAQARQFTWNDAAARLAAAYAAAFAG